MSGSRSGSSSSSSKIFKAKFLVYFHVGHSLPDTHSGDQWSQAEQQHGESRMQSFSVSMIHLSGFVSQTEYSMKYRKQTYWREYTETGLKSQQLCKAVMLIIHHREKLDKRTIGKFTLSEILTFLGSLPPTPPDPHVQMYYLLRYKYFFVLGY